MIREDRVIEILNKDGKTVQKIALCRYLAVSQFSSSSIPMIYAIYENEDGTMAKISSDYFRFVDGNAKKSITWEIGRLKNESKSADKGA